MKLKNISLFFLAVLISVLTSYLLKEFVYDDDYWSYVLQDKFTLSQIRMFLQKKNSSEWIMLIGVPIALFLKVGVVTLCILCGIFIFNEELSTFSVFRICLKAEFIFLIPPIIQLVWFGFNSNHSIHQISSFPSFSLRDLFDNSTLDKRLAYPLGILNIFEVAYILTIAYSIAVELNSTFTYSLRLVAFSYGLAILLWVMVVVYMISIFS